MKKCIITLFALLFAPAVSAATKQPNVIVLFTDDQGYADLGLHGSQIVKTPNIDSIGRNGIHFTSGYVAAPQCGPSRAGILSGRYPQRFGMEINAASAPGFGMPSDIPLIGNYMKKAGYVTAAVGKWHVGNTNASLAINRGFDWVWSMKGEKPDELQGVKIDNGHRTPTSTHRTNYLTLGALHFIEKNKAKPFFMYLAYHVPHAPYISTPNWMDKNKHVANKDKRVLAGMISELDDSVGRILAKLRELKLEEDTLIFYISDNGAQLAAKYPATVGSNDPLKGKKGTTYEGGVRVPWLVQWKGTIPAGQVVDDPVISLDVLPTALAAAGREDLITGKLDGVNLLPFFKKQSALPSRKLYFRWRGWFAVREDKWNAVYPAPLFQTPPEKIVPLSEAKLELYDMSRDKEQRSNIATQQPERVAKLKQSLVAWNRELTAPGWIAPRDVSVLNRIYGKEGMSHYPGLSYKTVAQKRPPKTADGGRSPERLMQLRDLDQDGKLTLKEYIGNTKGRNVPALTRRFNQRDANKDAKLTLEELKKTKDQ